MGGGAQQLEDAAASSRRQQQHSAGPPSAAADAALKIDTRSPDEVDDGRGCDAPATTTNIGGDGQHPLVWLAILKVGLMADTAWCSGDIHERARRLWLSFHRWEPPDRHLREMAGEAAPQCEPLTASLWKSIASVRDLWEQQPPAATTHTTLAAAALFLWHGCAQWPAHDDDNRRDTCCCSCCPHQGLSWPNATMLQLNRVGDSAMPGNALLPEPRQALALGRGRTLAALGAVPRPVLGSPGAHWNCPVRLSSSCARALYMANLRPPSTGSTCPVT
ncbi:hypothetical protein HPB50_025559 [Hyalomma asiaticum]|uniref:Uncharacterized protein n=1 Tax=Hyalomma asiaticum TaxID=266040 RepID=A0ACB7RNK8_HYAAI|nr:hypothetical protein HPB50_025559 [Hyalomma asiaticum]